MTIASLPQKSIQYDPITKDYRMTLNGEYVGSAACYHSAEVELDRLAYEQLDRAGIEPELLLSATALDSGSSVEEIAAEYAEALPHAQERTCEGLQFPCDRPVTHCGPLDLGHDISGKAVLGSIELCDEHAAEWLSYNTPPSGPFCFFHGGPADHETHECPRLEEIADRDEERHRTAPALAVEPEPEPVPAWLQGPLPASPLPPSWPERPDFYIVTNGQEYAYWHNRGVWDVTDELHGKCLLNDYNARAAQRYQNDICGEGDPEWQIIIVTLEAGAVVDLTG